MKNKKDKDLFYKTHSFFLRNGEEIASINFQHYIFKGRSGNGPWHDIITDQFVLLIYIRSSVYPEREFFTSPEQAKRWFKRIYQLRAEHGNWKKINNHE